MNTKQKSKTGKIIEFWRKAVDLGAVDGAEVKLLGLEMRFERNKKKIKNLIITIIIIIINLILIAFN